MIPNNAVMDAVSHHSWTALILSPDGDVVELVPLSTLPTAESLLDFARTQARGRRFRLVQRTDLSQQQLETLLAELRQPAVKSHAEAAVGTAIRDYQPLLHPLTPIRGIADSISSWLARRFW